MADNHYRLENLQNKCRLCSSSAALVNIFDDRLEFKDNMAEVIEVTTGVTITKSDEISRMLCSKCLHVTIRMYKFRATSMINDMDLKERAAKQKTIHKSMLEIFKKYPKIKVPPTVIHQNVLPKVFLEQEKTINFKKITGKLSSTRMVHDVQPGKACKNNYESVENHAKKLNVSKQSDSCSKISQEQTCKTIVNQKVNTTKRKTDSNWDHSPKKILKMEENLRKKENEERCKEHENNRNHLKKKRTSIQKQDKNEEFVHKPTKKPEQIDNDKQKNIEIEKQTKIHGVVQEQVENYEKNQKFAEKFKLGEKEEQLDTNVKRCDHKYREIQEHEQKQDKLFQEERKIESEPQKQKEKQVEKPVQDQKQIQKGRKIEQPSQNQKEKQLEKQIQDQKQTQIGSKIEEQSENQREKQVEKQVQDQKQIQKKQKIEEQNQKEKQVEKQVQGQKQIQKGRKIEEQSQNQKEKQVEKQIQDQNQIQKGRKFKEQSQNQKEKQVEKQVQDQKQIQKGRKIEEQSQNQKEKPVVKQVQDQKQIQKERKIEEQSQNQEEKQIEKQVQDQKQIQKGRKIEEQSENEKEKQTEKQVQDQRQIQKGRKIEEQSQNQKEKQVEQHVQDQKQIQKGRKIEEQPRTQKEQEQKGEKRSELLLEEVELLECLRNQTEKQEQGQKAQEENTQKEVDQEKLLQKQQEKQQQNRIQKEQQLIQKIEKIQKLKPIDVQEQIKKQHNHLNNEENVNYKNENNHALIQRLGKILEISQKDMEKTELNRDKKGEEVKLLVKKQNLDQKLEERIEKEQKNTDKPKVLEQNDIQEQSREQTINPEQNLDKEMEKQVQNISENDVENIDCNQKQEECDSLFTIRAVSPLLICDICNKVFYATKDLKRHKRIHMRCSLCRATFSSMEKTEEHKNECSVKKILSNDARIEIPRCDEIEEIRRKYSNAFEALIIEISDDEEDTTKNCSTSKGVNEVEKLDQKNLLCSGEDKDLAKTSNTNDKERRQSEDNNVSEPQSQSAPLLQLIKKIPNTAEPSILDILDRIKSTCSDICNKNESLNSPGKTKDTPALKNVKIIGNVSLNPNTDKEPPVKISKLATTDSTNDINKIPTPNIAKLDKGRCGEVSNEKLISEKSTTKQNENNVNPNISGTPDKNIGQIDNKEKTSETQQSESHKRKSPTSTNVSPNSKKNKRKKPLQNTPIAPKKPKIASTSVKANPEEPTSKPSTTTPFEPKLTIGDISALNLNFDDEDAKCVKNLLKLLKLNKGGKSIQTDLPCNNNIQVSKNSGIVFEMKNLRNYLTFTNIPVTMSYNKMITMKYTFEPSTLMKNQRKILKPAYETSKGATNIKKNMTAKETQHGIKKQTETPKKSGEIITAINIEMPNKTSGTPIQNSSVEKEKQNSVTVTSSVSESNIGNSTETPLVDKNCPQTSTMNQTGEIRIDSAERSKCINQPDNSSITILNTIIAQGENPQNVKEQSSDLQTQKKGVEAEENAYCNNLIIPNMMAVTNSTFPQFTNTVSNMPVPNIINMQQNPPHFYFIRNQSPMSVVRQNPTYILPNSSINTFVGVNNASMVHPIQLGGPPNPQVQSVPNPISSSRLPTSSPSTINGCNTLPQANSSSQITATSNLGNNSSNYNFIRPKEPSPKTTIANSDNSTHVFKPPLAPAAKQTVTSLKLPPLRRIPSSLKKIRVISSGSQQTNTKMSNVADKTNSCDNSSVSNGQAGGSSIQKEQTRQNASTEFNRPQIPTSYIRVRNLADLK